MPVLFAEGVRFQVRQLRLPKAYIEQLKSDQAAHFHVT